MSKIKILLAEDDVNLGNLLKNYLNAKNYITSLYVNGSQALDAFASGKFNLCIFDIMMPEMDGLTLARETGCQTLIYPSYFLQPGIRKKMCLKDSNLVPTII